MRQVIIQRTRLARCPCVFNVTVSAYRTGLPQVRPGLGPARRRERLYDIAGSLNHVTQSGPDGVGPPVELLEPRRLLEAYEGTAPAPLTPDEHRWLPGALALIPLHWAATAGLADDGIHQAESAMTAAEAWWSRRAELSS